MTRRPMLVTGLIVVLRNPGALLWTYAFNLGIALLFSLALHAQLASVLSHSLAAERLNSAFDLGTLAETQMRISQHAPSAGPARYLGLPVYLLIYFVLVPGTLFSYHTAAPPRLAILLSSGLRFFWRFVRITLLTLLASAIVLGPLLAFNNGWANHVDDHLTGESAFVHKLVPLLGIALVAALLRLYFDLVEVYTVLLADQYRPDGRPDRRVRSTLGPALRTLWRNLPRAYGAFLLLALLGFGAMAWSGWIGLRTLAQPRVWPQFLLAQFGLLMMLFSRFWQRGAEFVLACDNPLPVPVYAPLETAFGADLSAEPAIPSTRAEPLVGPPPSEV